MCDIVEVITLDVLGPALGALEAILAPLVATAPVGSPPRLPSNRYRSPPAADVSTALSAATARSAESEMLTVVKGEEEEEEEEYVDWTSLEGFLGKPHSFLPLLAQLTANVSGLHLLNDSINLLPILNVTDLPTSLWSLSSLSLSGLSQVSSLQLLSPIGNQSLAIGAALKPSAKLALSLAGALSLPAFSLNFSLSRNTSEERRHTMVVIEDPKGLHAGINLRVGFVGNVLAAGALQWVLRTADAALITSSRAYEGLSAALTCFLGKATESLSVPRAFFAADAFSVEQLHLGPPEDAAPTGTQLCRRRSKAWKGQQKTIFRAISGAAALVFWIS